MKLLFIPLLCLVFASCNRLSQGLSVEEHKDQIDAITQSNISSLKLADGWYSISRDTNDFMRIDRKTDTEIFINPKPIVTPKNFIKTEEFESNSGEHGLAVYFDEPGSHDWEKATNVYSGSKLVFILDNEILTIPTINSKITNGVCVFWQSELTDSDWTRIKKVTKN